MKKLLLATLTTLASLGAMAQNNVLLTQPFWQGQPSVEQVKAEIAKGANPSQFNGNSFDPVVMAINAKAPNETIKYLIDQPGNDVNKLTHDGRIYLHWAANSNNPEIMEYVISKGSKLDLMDSHGTTPLLFAASAGQQNTKIYDVLLAHGDNLKKNVNGAGANALLVAIANDKELVLTNYFVSKGLDIKSTDAAGNNAFDYAVRSGNIELLKTLQQKGLKPGPNAMLQAAQAGGGRRGAPAPPTPLSYYQYLESLGVKASATNKTGENALHYLARRPGQAETIAYFISKGANVNQPDEEGNTPFMYAAASNRDTAVITALLKGVKNVNLGNAKGETALAMAVRSNSAETVNYLIAKGADTKVLDKKGNNLAYYLMESYRPAFAGRGAPGGPAAGDDFGAKMTLLKDKGVKLTAPQKDGSTLYHLAVAKNDVALLKRLEPLGLDVNAKNTEGLTALHKAALIAKDDVMMKYFISIGAKKDAVTNFKETAYDLAAENESLTKNNVSVTFLK
ncbi:ankyrin repeat domain-containing protein [Mucilaginibacter terrae]|uniref:Ankyrin repeat protein n=1 Tax=Mucilaginibacter terrae TaxID=1955052 RepID=A0ABU3GQ69_9SPHI|nr:ankyrin repeat domain-containing protein [Mucilaginibacter terrae]MDT3401927.1 ankyrin repeat protein [Mucilaginibacter terrae]